MSTDQKVTLDEAIKLAQKRLTTAKLACDSDGHICAPDHMRAAVQALQAGLKRAGCEEEG